MGPELEFLNITQAIEWSIRKTFDPDNVLRIDFIKTVHKKMFSEVWPQAGQFRKFNRIEPELRKLLVQTKCWIRNNSYEKDEIAIRFMHRLLRLQCFHGGNGSHARLMADILIDSISERRAYSWQFWIIVDREKIRAKYLKALEWADKGHMKPLIRFARD